MLKQFSIGLCALVVAGAGYTTVMADALAKAGAPRSIPIAASAPASQKSTAVDAQNTKCIIMSDNDSGDSTVEYKGKRYHVCCSDCIEVFNKDPEKYVKAFDADPASFGVKAAK